jgi:hypothetical protein
VGVATIRRAELAKTETSMTAANDIALRSALQSAGVEFVEGNCGPGGTPLKGALDQTQVQDSSSGKTSRKVRVQLPWIFWHRGSHRWCASEHKPFLITSPLVHDALARNVV